jgi:hypothetical protein
MTGWLYWYSWVVVIAFEAVAGGTVLQQWIDAPLAVLSAAVLLVVVGGERDERAPVRARPSTGSRWSRSWRSCCSCWRARLRCSGSGRASPAAPPAWPASRSRRLARFPS